MGGHCLPPFGPTPNPMVLFPHTRLPWTDSHPAASTPGRRTPPGAFWTLVWKQRRPTAVSSSPPARSPQRLPVRPARAQSSRPPSRSRGITESGLHVHGVPAHLEISRTSGGEAPGGGGSCSHIHHWRWLSRTWSRPAGWERGGDARSLWLTFRSPADRKVPSPKWADAGGWGEQWGAQDPVLRAQLH